MPIDDLFADGKKPNLVFIITDQERALMHWPDDFAEKNLPALSRLMNNGLSFHQAFTNACCCSPSRATLLTSRYPSDHGVTTTGSPQPPFSLPKDLTNLATVLNKAGYRCEWRGKWHLGGGGPAEYGFNGWVPPDAGNYLSLNDTLGAGFPDNDGRFLEEIMEFLDSQSVDNNDQPFCLVASFVNPHDVYVAQYEADGTLGYTPEDFNRVSVPLPSNAFEDLEFNNRDADWELYDLKHDPNENDNRAGWEKYAEVQSYLDNKLQELMKEKNTMPTNFTWPPKATENSRGTKKSQEEPLTRTTELDSSSARRKCIVAGA